MNKSACSDSSTFWPTAKIQNSVNSAGTFLYCLDIDSPATHIVLVTSWETRHSTGLNLQAPFPSLQFVVAVELYVQILSIKMQMRAGTLQRKWNSICPWPMLHSWAEPEEQILLQFYYWYFTVSFSSLSSHSLRSSTVPWHRPYNLLQPHSFSCNFTASHCLS